MTAYRGVLEACPPGEEAEEATLGEGAEEELEEEEGGDEGGEEAQEA